MADVQDLLREFIARFEAGERVRPPEFLARVEGTDRGELAALLDGYLERAPRRPFDAGAFAGSPARPLVDDLAQAIDGRAGTWPVLLPRLRVQARLRRADLVERLAAALGVAGQRERVGAYYHAMEQGQLDPQGVSDRVLEALGALTGTTARALRDAATALQPPRPGAPALGASFARTAAPEPEHLAEMASPPADAAAATDGSADEVDRLFTGGVR